MANLDHFRKDFPSFFLGQTKAEIKAYEFIAGLPSGNIFSILFENEGISPSANATRRAAAIVCHNLSKDDAADAHRFIQVRDKFIKPILNHMESGFQGVKALNPSNVLEVTNWGAICTPDGKITIPTNPGDLLDMLLVYDEKYSSYTGDTCPILGLYTSNGWIILQDHNMRLAAVANNGYANDKFVTSEYNTQQRNLKWAPNLIDLVKIYNLAKVVYKNDWRVLAQMGFDVVSTPTTHKDQTSTALQLQHTLIHGAIIGSVIHSLVDFDIPLHPGLVIGDHPKILHAHEIMAVEKGMSSFVMENLDALRIAKILTTVRSHG